MKVFKCPTFLIGFALVVGLSVRGQTIIADNYNVTGNGTGFGLDSGVNTGINPSATRLTGTAAANLRYITTTTKAATAFGISNNRLRVTPAANPGRFTLSAEGSTPFNFAPALGTAAATPANPIAYDLTISMVNNSAGSQRFSFALGVAEGDANTWDFGIQLYRANSTDNFYTIGKRIDTAASGLASDLNTFITNTAPGTSGDQITFLMRVTDAGPESAAFNSRVQLSTDGGLTWFYDTASDADLPNGWRLNGSGRYVIWDVAPDAGNVNYDNFSLRPAPVSAALVSPSTNAQNVGASALLKVIVTNTIPGDLTVTFFGREKPTPGPGPDFCIAVLPDTQNYSREAPDAASRQMWYAQTDWIVTNRVKENIVYVAHLGDIVQNGDIKNGNPNTLEWSIATNAMYRLERSSTTLLTYGVPYGLAVGNHDQQPIGDENGTTTFYNDHFGVSHFSGRPYYGGNFSSNNDSHFDLFSASGLDFIVLYFEYGRYGSSILNWANNVLATNQHRRCIVVTHHAGSAATPSSLSAQGSAIYEGLKANTNFFMMLGGHVTGEGSRQNTFNGNTVRTFISDYQGRPNGGNGWMRLMYFSPSNNQVVIQTYSPWLDQYETDANSELFFNYNLQLPGPAPAAGTPYVALGTNTGVAPGAITGCVWPGLQANKTYDWYVSVTDAQGNSVLSDQWPFTTTNNAAPVASNQLVNVTGDAPASLTLTAVDANGDPLTFQINSQPLDGLVTSFNPANGEVTYLPSRGYRGPDRIIFSASDSFTNSAPATMNLIVVAPPDTNANNLPDAWEAAYGITDPNADDDGDGADNLSEYKANTNPTNAASRLRIMGANWQTNGQFGLTWSAVGGTRYRVQYAEGITNGGPASAGFFDVFRSLAEEMDASPHGQSSTQFFADPFTGPGNPPVGGRYYRVKVLP